MKSVIASTLGLSALVACAEFAPTDEIRITDARINPPLGGRDVGAAYMTFTNFDAPTAIVSVTSPDADTVELHRSSRTDGIARMDKLDTLPLPTGDTVLQQGGLHFMVFGLTADEVADGVPFTITLKDGRTLEVTAN